MTDKHIRVNADEIKEKGEVFVDHYDKSDPPQNPIKLTIGDERLPHGLWRAMEHMRKGERARIMMKPKYGYAYEKSKDIMFFPRGWTEGDKKEALLTRRVFFEIYMHDWVTRHDLNADGIFIKAIHEKGDGFLKPSQFDFVKFKLRMYQGATEFFDG